MLGLETSKEERWFADWEVLEFLKPSPLLRELFLLHDLSKNPHQTQAQLAFRTGIRRNEIQKLIWLNERDAKIRKQGKRPRYTGYLLTPEGQLRKRSLWRAYLEELIQILDHGQKTLGASLETIVRAAVKEIYTVGAENAFHAITWATMHCPVEVLGNIDSSNPRALDAVRSGSKERLAFLVTTIHELNPSLREELGNLQEKGARVFWL